MLSQICLLLVDAKDCGMVKRTSVWFQTGELQVVGMDARLEIAVLGLKDTYTKCSV